MSEHTTIDINEELLSGGNGADDIYEGVQRRPENNPEQSGLPSRPANTHVISVLENRIENFLFLVMIIPIAGHSDS